MRNVCCFVVISVVCVSECFDSMKYSRLRSSRGFELAESEGKVERDKGVIGVRGLDGS